MVAEERWKIAQSYEKNWWNEKANLVDFEFYKNYSNDLKNFINQHFIIDQQTKILEVGSGAGGIITFLTESENRYAIDPLEDFYSSVPNFNKQRDSQVHYQTAIGENLPFEDEYFDFIIMDNVLDHCDNPAKVMEEVRRTLKSNSFIYFKQNSYHFWGKFIRWVMEFFLIDKGHPFTFSLSQINQMIKKNNFQIVKKTSIGYLPTWKNEISSKSLKDKLKALLLVTRNKRIFLLRKNG